jgi:hypothetical protein
MFMENIMIYLTKKDLTFGRSGYHNLTHVMINHRFGLEEVLSMREAYRIGGSFDRSLGYIWDLSRVSIKDVLDRN